MFFVVIVVIVLLSITIIRKRLVAHIWEQPLPQVRLRTLLLVVLRQTWRKRRAPLVHVYVLGRIASRFLFDFQPRKVLGLIPNT